MVEVFRWDIKVFHLNIFFHIKTKNHNTQPHVPIRQKQLQSRSPRNSFTTFPPNSITLYKGAVQPFRVLKSNNFTSNCRRIKTCERRVKCATIQHHLLQRRGSAPKLTLAPNYLKQETDGWSLIFHDLKQLSDKWHLNPIFRVQSRALGPCFEVDRIGRSCSKILTYLCTSLLSWNWSLRKSEAHGFVR